MHFHVPAIFSLLLILFSVYTQAKDEEVVERWASRLGKELWELGLSVTRVSDIKQSYKNLNARVLPTDGEGILHNIVSNVDLLLKQKMDSVMCLIENAEVLSEQSTDDNETYIYFSSKYSPRPGVEEEPVPGVNYTFYKTLEVEPDHHFYNIDVNTSHSAVHVPTDVYDQGGIVRNSMKWSEDLDETFISNYQADPTMSWQYFGSATGFLRHYPAIAWAKDPEGMADVFDCRTRFWYIEAATCTKDVIILMDNTGSMEGNKHTIAKLTVFTLLDTLSNNDFVNIYRFNETVKAMVPCFSKDTLVQATPENILQFKKYIKIKTKESAPQEKANFKLALTSAFEIITKYRKAKNCPNDICNQAIILITDSIPENVTGIFEKYNWFDGRSRIPVRVFVYYIGREISNLQAIRNIACMNRGHFGLIKSLEEVRSEVLKYLSVIARPMVLQLVEHPLSWTHSFVDATGQQDPHFSQDSYRFMTSVSGPAFDKIPHNKVNETELPVLLGVAGTDVLVSDIKSLTLPYKIGANGYAFVITNNGYLLFHPDLRPTYDCGNKTCVKDNYNSIDLTEVELLDDETSVPRKPSPQILNLRKLMVNGNESSIPGLKIKFHYDDMRRVGVETRNYFFAPLNNTPFTMGLVLPHSYGNFWIKAGDEIMKSKQMGIPISSYFKGNWRIHPDWIYCDYHRTSVRNFKSSEEKLLHFLEKISEPNWKWKERFPQDMETDSSTYDCNRPSIDETEYYCDKELMQLLVFDAKITEVSYKTKEWAAKDRRETELVKRFGATLRFLATQSGLTRWQYIPEHIESPESFGDTNKRALEEVWYRSAVLHHQLDPDAFVFSVPFNAGDPKNMEVTASYAIFPKDGGHEAPGSVVGFKIKRSSLQKRFIDITSRPNCDGCASCDSHSWDCYLIDGNGYIVLSEEENDTGRFFGELEGAIMEAMITKNIFRHVRMFDYQSICTTIVIPSSASRGLLSTEIYCSLEFGPRCQASWFGEREHTKHLAASLEQYTHTIPFRVIFSLIEWIIGKTLWLILESEMFKHVHAEEDDYYDIYVPPPTPPSVSTTKKPDIFTRMKQPITVYNSCDKAGNLYLLQHLSKEGYHSSTHFNCSRPFYVKRLPHTNLLLLVVNVLHQSCYRKLSASMEEIVYPDFNDPSCQKLNLNTLPRRRLSGCFNTHHLEELFYICSDGESLRARKSFIVFILLSHLILVLFIADLCNCLN